MSELLRNDESRRSAETNVENWIEIIAAFLLAIAVVGTAYCAWQSTRWGGLETLRYAEATTARVESAKALTIADQQLTYDANTFVEVAIAFLEGNVEAARRVADLFIRDEFRPHVEEWVARNPLANPNAPSNPFELEGFTNAKLEESAKFENIAMQRLNQAKQARQTGDNYILATVFFALVLFFAGLTTKFKNTKIRAVLLVFAAIGAIIGLIRTATLPFH